MQNRKRDTDVQNRLLDSVGEWEGVCFERTVLKHVYYQGWNRSPAQVGCVRQVLGPGVLGRPRGIGWRGRWEGGSGWGIHVKPWRIHVNAWPKPLQYCKLTSLQLIKINGKKIKLSSICKMFSQLLWSSFLFSPSTSCGIPFTYILVFFKYILHIFGFKSLWWTISFFLKSFHSCFPCLYLTYPIFFSFMNIQIIVLVSILMSFPANYVMYILTVFLLIDFSVIMDILLLLYTSEKFFSF